MDYSKPIIDTIHHEKIRENVKNIIREASILNDISGKLVMDIAPQIYAGAREFFSKATIITFDIDKDSGADIIGDICETNTNIEPEKFDIIICTEVLEHTRDPFAAASELHRILKKDGLLYATTPFNFKIHSPSPDYWRFTEYGLRELFKSFSSVCIKSFESYDGRIHMPIQYATVAKK